MVLRPSRGGGRRREVHPDDVLKKLARTGRASVGPTIYSPYRKPPRDAYRTTVVGAIAGLALLSAIALFPFLVERDSITVNGIINRQAITPSALATTEIALSIRPASAIPSATITVDGVAVPTEPLRAGVRLVMPTLAEGSHELRIRSGKGLLWRGPASKTIRFTVDGTAPGLRVRVPTRATEADDPIVISGRADADAAVTVAGVLVSQRSEDGGFAVSFRTPPIGTVRVVARDAAGNATVRRVRTRVHLPTIRAVHLTSQAWADEASRRSVLELAAAGRINAVQIDLKDESGEIAYASALLRAKDLGAVRPRYDLHELVRDLHARGVRVVGRIAVFRDAVLARAAVNGGSMDQLVLDAEGKPWTDRDVRWINPLSRSAQDYVLALAREAAQAGVDDLVLDRLQRPVGDITTMRFAGAAGEPAAVEKALVGAVDSFVRRVGDGLRGTRARLGVMVVGTAAQRPADSAQDVALLARAADYVLPTVFPSDWAPGSYAVADPVASPYVVVVRALRDFQRLVRGTDAVIVPVLQDYSQGRNYGTAEVRKQIEAALDAGLAGYLVWDPKGSYHGDALDPDAPRLVDPSLDADAPPVTAVTVPTLPTTTAG